MRATPNSRLPLFTKLQTSLNLALYKQQNEEPEYRALDSLTDHSSRFSRLSEYASDILRIFRELELAYSLVEKIPDEEFFIKHESTREDYVMYHYGHFLDLVHQVKDKLTRLTKGLTDGPPFIEPKKANPTDLANKEKIKGIPGLSLLLMVWDSGEEKTHSIAVALRRRTQYHHFRNRLHLNNDFLDVKLYRVMQEAKAQEMLSEYGRKQVKERGEAGFERWQSGVQEKIKNTISEIQANIEGISGVLLGHIPLPVLETDAVEIFDKYYKVEESLKIKNIATSDYEKTGFNPIIKTIETILGLVLGENLLSLYLVGSTTRGDSVRGTSDVNFVLVLKDTAEGYLVNTQNVINGIILKTGEYVDCVVCTEATFRSEDQKLVRFICKTDGLLLCGADLVSEEQFPKPGLELVCLFKRSILKEIESVEEKVNCTPPPNQDEVTILGRKVAKIGLRLMYWSVLADTAKYERSFKGMYEMILSKYPENRYMTDIYYGLAIGSGTVDLENLKHIIGAFSEDSSLGALIKQLNEKCEQLKNRKKY